MNDVFVGCAGVLQLTGLAEVWLRRLMTPFSVLIMPRTQVCSSLCYC